MNKTKEITKRILSLLISASMCITMFLCNIGVLGKGIVSAAETHNVMLLNAGQTIGAMIKKFDYECIKANGRGIEKIERVYNDPISGKTPHDVNSNNDDLTLNEFVGIHEGPERAIIVACDTSSGENILQIYVMPAGDDANDDTYCMVFDTGTCSQLFAGPTSTGIEDLDKNLGLYGLTLEEGLKDLESIELGTVDLSAVKDTSAMFKGAKNLITITSNGKPLFSKTSNPDILPILWMNDMFYGCENITELDLTSIYTNDMKNEKYLGGMKHMFYDTPALSKIKVSGDSTSNLGWEFLSKTDLNGNWYIAGKPSIIVSASNLESTWGDFFANKVCPDGDVELIRTNDAITNLCAKDYYEVSYSPTANHAYSGFNNIWKIDRKDNKFTAYCINANWTTSTEGVPAGVSSGVPHGYYKRISTAGLIEDDKKLRPSVNKYNETYPFEIILKGYVDSTTGLLNVVSTDTEHSNYYGSTEPVAESDRILGAENLSQALETLLYFASKDDNYKNNYEKTQKAVWYLTNYYKIPGHEDDFDANYFEEHEYTYNNIKGKVSLDLFASKEYVQNLASLRYINIQKVDEEGEALSGAKFRLYKGSYSSTDETANLFYEWITDKNTPYSFTLELGQTYVLHEVETPYNHHPLSKDVKIQVDEVGKITVVDDTSNETEIETNESGQTLKVKNKSMGKKVIIHKSNITRTKEIPGASLKIVGKDATTTIDPIEWTSTTEPYKVVLKEGEYTLTEDISPLGYERKKESIDFEITKEASGEYKILVGATDNTNGIYLENDAQKFTIPIEKRDLENNMLGGATLKVQALSTIEDFTPENNGNIITSNSAASEIDLIAGTYELEEVTPPTGYDKADNIKFKVVPNETDRAKADIYILNEDNVIISDAVEKVVMVDGLLTYDVDVIKQAEGTKEVLSGAKLKLQSNGTAIDGTSLPEEGIVIETTEEAYTVKDLKPGQYTLKEEIAPVGYKIASDINFTLEGDGKITIGTVSSSDRKVIMKDALEEYSIKINKVNIKGEQLAGAILELSGTPHDEMIVPGFPLSFTTIEDAYTYTFKPGKYKLAEKTAPEGFEIAKEISFEITKEGKVSVNGEEKDELTMVDELIAWDVKFNKYDNSFTNLEGATLSVTGEAEDGSSTVISWKTEKKAHKEKLKAGTYVLSESTAPLGYKIANNITFKVTKTGNVEIDDTVQSSATVNMIDEKMSQYTVAISKTTKDGDPLPDASLTISGKTSSGSELEPIAFASTSGAYNVLLYPGQYTLTETKAPNGYKIANPINFKVADNGSITVDGNGVSTVTMIDEKESSETTGTNASATALPNQIKIIKQNIAGQMIGGASLQICSLNNGYATTGSATQYNIDNNGNVTNTTATPQAEVKGGTPATNNTEQVATADYGTPVATWLTAENTPYVTTLSPGNYVLHEALPPTGYSLAQDIPFSVNANGKVVYNGTEIANNTIVMIDGIVAGQKIDYIKTGYDPLWFKLLTGFLSLASLFVFIWNLKMLIVKHK